MKILHVASFDGNIGDNASHMGFRKILSSLFGKDFQVDKLEIRKFYNNYSLPDKLRFDEAFARRANKYDLLFIGGGGFLDFWVSNSATGTTINMAPEVLRQIKVPLIISSVGCMPHKDVPEGNIEKFRAFLDQLLSRKNTFVAVRNDGSKQTLIDFIGQQYHDAIPEVLDHGFFYENDGSLYKPFDGEYVIINTTADQVQMKNREIGKVNGASYIEQMNLVLQHIIEQTNLNIVFAPHIYSDYKAIDALLQQVNDFYLRTRIGITPYVQGDYGCDQIFSAYKNSILALGMRFHANVCSIAMGAPSIGLAALDRVSSVYESMKLSENLVKVDSAFGSVLIEKMQAVLNTHSLKIESGSEVLHKRKEETMAIYQKAVEELQLV